MRSQKLKNCHPRARRARRPIVLLSVACTLFVGVSVLAFQLAAAATPKGKPTAVKVTLGGKGKAEYTVKLSKRTIGVGKVTFTVTNKGKKRHSFKLCSKKTSSTKKNTCVGSSTSMLRPGKSEKLTVTLTTGSYLFLSGGAGDAKKGMKGLVKIVNTKSAEPTAIKVTLGEPGDEYVVRLSQNQAPVGPVTFNVTNMGKKKHSFQICLQTTYSATADICLIGPSTRVLAPRESATITAVLSLGIHQYLSAVPGDAKKGMKGGLDVVPYTPPAPKEEEGEEAECKNPVATTVTVTAIDFDLKLSQSSVPCGMVTFAITNDSEVTEHNFSIAFGNGRKASEVVSPGGRSTTLKLELGPGPHRYQSDGPVDVNAGMLGILAVTG